LMQVAGRGVAWIDGPEGLHARRLMSLEIGLGSRQDSA
jgi:hypothetical protein